MAAAAAAGAGRWCCSLLLLPVGVHSRRTSRRLGQLRVCRVELCGGFVNCILRALKLRRRRLQLIRRHDIVVEFVVEFCNNASSAGGGGASFSRVRRGPAANASERRVQGRAAPARGSIANVTRWRRLARAAPPPPPHPKPPRGPRSRRWRRRCCSAGEPRRRRLRPRGGGAIRSLRGGFSLSLRASASSTCARPRSPCDSPAAEAASPPPRWPPRWPP